METFLDNVTFPVVSANTDVTNEPRLTGKFSKSWTTVISREQIGVVGYITPETAEISSGGALFKLSTLNALTIKCLHFDIFQG